MHLTTSPILRSVRQVGSIQPKSSFIKRYRLRGRSPLARPLTSVPLSPRRSPHALAACTRPPHALAARARLCSYRSQSAGDGSPQCSGPAYVVPSCPPTLHAHAAAPIHHPQCPRLDPLRLHPPHHTSRRLTALSSTPVSPPSFEQGPGLSVTSSARSARDGAAPLTPVRTTP